MRASSSGDPAGPDPTPAHGASPSGTGRSGRSAKGATSPGPGERRARVAKAAATAITEKAKAKAKAAAKASATIEAGAAAVERKVKAKAGAEAASTERTTAGPVDPKVSAIERKVTAKLARQQQKLEEKAGREIAAKAARRQQKIAEKSALQAQKLDRLATHLEALDIWTRPTGPGRKPRFSRDQIAATALHIADTEGVDALSMRRLAADLDAGTMTLYHYVRTKDELLSLVCDAVMGEVALPVEQPMPGDWREALTLLAHRTRSVLLRHPWMLDIADDPPVGPNAVRHFDQSLQAVASLPTDLESRFDVLALVDEYVFGYCLNHRNNIQLDGGLDDGMIAYVEGLLATGSYPALDALADEHGLDGAWTRIESHLRDDRRFERNLARLLDGIDAGLPSRRASRSSRRPRRAGP